MRKSVPKRLRDIIPCLFLILFGLTGGVVVPVGPQASNSPPAEKIVQATFSNADWHDGGPQSTPELNVTYTEEYSTIRNLSYNNNTTWLGRLSQAMWLTYKDGTESSLDFQINCAFQPGGLNITGQKVLDWNKLSGVELIMETLSHSNGNRVSSMYSFQGFNIVSGNASQVRLSRTYLDGMYQYSLNNVIGSINYWNSSARIGNVVLSTIPYTYQGNTLQESVASFNVTIGSYINDLPLRWWSYGQVMVSAPTVLMFKVTHTITQTTYKYGAHIDWSTAKNFPTSTSMTTGQSFSLVAADMLMFNYGYNSTAVNEFSTDPNNETAIYLVQGKEACRELFTTQYTLDGNSQAHDTTRIYMRDAWENGPANVSAVYVIFDGFNYNESTGVSFDPEVIIPNTLASSTDWGLIIGLSLAGVAAVSTAIIVVVHRRRKQRLIETGFVQEPGQQPIE